MTKPLGKRTIMPVASRPWSARVATPEKPVHKDTAREKRERQICLNCELPECPHNSCPIATKDVNTKREIGKSGRPQKQMPQDFPQWAWKLTASVLAKQYGVGEKIIVRWRKELKNRP